MELKNKRVQYTVTNEDSNLKLTGEISLKDQTNDFSFNGSLSDLSDNYLGNFYYNEREDEKVDKSINGIDKDDLANAEALIASTITALRNELNF